MTETEPESSRVSNGRPYIMWKRDLVPISERVSRGLKRGNKCVYGEKTGEKVCLSKVGRWLQSSR